MEIFKHEDRFHDLLLKSCRGTLTPEEFTEYDSLEKARNAEIDAIEKPACDKLDKEIGLLKQAISEMEGLEKKYNLG